MPSLLRLYRYAAYRRPERFSSGIKREELVPVVERRDRIRRGVGRGSASGMNARLARREKTLRLECTHHLD